MAKQEHLEKIVYFDLSKVECPDKDCEYRGDLLNCYFSEAYVECSEWHKDLNKYRDGFWGKWR